MSAPPTPETPDAGGTDAHGMDAVRESQDRALEREGIPMYLALVRENRSDAFPEVEAATRAAGAAVAARLDAHRAEVAPSQRDGDLGVTMTVLAAVAYADFDRSALR